MVPSPLILEVRIIPVVIWGLSYPLHWYISHIRSARIRIQLPAPYLAHLTHSCTHKQLALLLKKLCHELGDCISVRKVPHIIMRR